ncbi:MAG: hypothetical protein DRQ37_03660 [Gammaproteobacteria bacterium]|nr:MAG: hypothetical protein DRQ37_03660 [Gammaproteobacteria bacterium]
MNAPMLLAGSGPLVILTSHDSPDNPEFLAKLRAKGIEKFLAYSIPLDDAKKQYGAHFDHVMNDLYETDDLRVLDYTGERAFRLFRLRDLDSPIIYEPDT